jgi:hypothetical protein
MNEPSHSVVNERAFPLGRETTTRQTGSNTPASVESIEASADRGAVGGTPIAMVSRGAMDPTLDRRDFLRRTAGTLALLLSERGLAAAQTTPDIAIASPPVRFGVIGLGRMGTRDSGDAWQNASRAGRDDLRFVRAVRPSRRGRRSAGHGCCRLSAHAGRRRRRGGRHRRTDTHTSRACVRGAAGGQARVL